LAVTLNDLDTILFDVEGQGTFDYTTTRGFEVVDVACMGQTGKAGGATAIVCWQPAAGGGFTDISDAMLAGWANIIVRADTINETAATFERGDTVRVTTNWPTVDAEIYVMVLPTTWIEG